ncbi:MAG TPA: hypothetical protein VGM93_02365 [Acidimicrobiales bacterium]
MARRRQQHGRTAALVAIAALVTTVFAASPASAQLQPGTVTNPPPTTANAGAARAAVTTDTQTVSAVPADVTPFVRDGTVNAVAVIGNKVVLGGDFTSARNRATGSPSLVRKYLLAFDRTTGAIDPNFHPTLDGEVYDLAAAPDGHSVLVGGRFKHADGPWAGGLAEYDMNTNAKDPAFNGYTDGTVYTIQVSGSTAYVGGTFSEVRTTARSRLAAVDVTTGAPLAALNLAVTQSATPGASAMVWKMAVNPAGTRLIIVGDFIYVAGSVRRQIAIINLAGTDTLSTWSTERFNHDLCSNTYDSHPRDVRISPDGKYFVIGSSGAWATTRSLCDAASRWEIGPTGANQQPTWVDYTGGDTITSLAVTGSTIYLGGHFRWMNNSNTPHGDAIGPGGVKRKGLAAVDPINGMILPWNPGRDLGYGVLDFAVTPDGIYIGHDTNDVGGKVEARVAYFPVAGGAVVPHPKDATLPTTLYTADGASRIVGRAFNGTSRPTTAVVVPSTERWSDGRGVFTAGWYVYSGWSDGSLRRRSFNGTSFGTVASVHSWWNTKGVRSAMFTDGRLYYTDTTENALFYRYFDAASGLVGSQKLTAVGSVAGIDWRKVTGMTFAGGKLIYTMTDGYLRVATAAFAVNGVPSITSAHAVAGPSIDGKKYTYVDLFTKPIG